MECWRDPQTDTWTQHSSISLSSFENQTKERPHCREKPEMCSQDTLNSFDLKFCIFSFCLNLRLSKPVSCFGDAKPAADSGCGL